MADNARTLRRAKVLTVAALALLVLLGGRTVFSRISNARSLEAGEDDEGDDDETRRWAFHGAVVSSSARGPRDRNRL